MREFPDHYEEEYVWLADLTDSAALISWGKFFFDSTMELVSDKNIHRLDGQHARHTSIGAFAKRLRDQAGKNIWMIGGGEIIASFLDEHAIDEFIISVVPIFIGEGIPLMAPRHREVLLHLRSVKPFPDGVVQVHYEVRPTRAPKAKRAARGGRIKRTS